MLKILKPQINFLSILIRVYLNYFFNLLKELELHDEQAIFSGSKFGLTLVALCMIFALMLILNSLMFFLII